MKMKLTSSLFALAAVSALFMTGCGDAKKDAAPVVNVGDDHSGYWCEQHSVPEKECGQCSTTLAASFKKKGDWCKKHDRPESQCFICNKGNEDKFIADYKTKFGKLPPGAEEKVEKKKETPEKKPAEKK